MVELQPSKLATWVRFPSPAPETTVRKYRNGGFFFAKHSEYKAPSACRQERKKAAPLSTTAMYCESVSLGKENFALRLTKSFGYVLLASMSFAFVARVLDCWVLLRSAKRRNSFSLFKLLNGTAIIYQSIYQQAHQRINCAEFDTLRQFCCNADKSRADGGSLVTYIGGHIRGCRLCFFASATTNSEPSSINE